MIRDATLADLPAILGITNWAILNTTALWTITPATLEARTAWWRERVARGFPVLVWATPDGIAGFASYGDFRPHDGYLHTVEHSIYVDPTAQGQGIGRKLLVALIDHATSSGKHVMVGGIEAGNVASIALHRSLGFTGSGVLREVGRKFDRWLDLQFMTRTL